MPSWLPAVIAVAAITSTYFFCVRPGMRKRCDPDGAGTDAKLDRQLAQLREEIRVLHAQDLLDAERTSPKPIPPQDS